MRTMKKWWERLEEMRSTMGWSKADLARRTGISYDNINKYLRGDVDQPRGETLQMIAKGAGVPLDWLLFGESKSSGPSIQDTKNIPVVGIVQAGAWLESDGLWPTEEEWIPVVPDPRYEPHRQWAVLVKGDSVNEVIQDGEYAHCVDIDCGRGVEEGDLVVVERVRQQGGLVETTIKQVKSNGNGPELWPRSTNRKYNGPIHIGHEDDEDIEVRIKGFVIGAYRKL